MEIFNTYNINPVLVRNTQNGVFNNTYFSITEVNSTLNFGEYITVSGTQLIAQNPISVKSTLLLEGSSTITGDVYLNASGTYNVTDFTWQIRTTNSNSWRDVVWAKELNLFACVSASANTSGVMTSPDGITWTTRTTVANTWVALTWSPELLLFVALSITGTGNRVMTSPDGITWTTRVSAANNNWSSVVWSKELNLFVAVAFSGTNDRVMTSPDGITWTTRFTPTNNQFYSIAWSPQLGLFAVVTLTDGTNNRIMTSPDGINWTTRATNNNRWRRIIWIEELNLFVASALPTTGQSNINLIMTSSNGIDWNIINVPQSNEWYGLVWAKEIGLIVAIAATGTNRVMTSPDGINWTLRSAAAANQWYSVTWSPELSRFVAVSFSGTNNRAMTWDIPRGGTFIIDSNTRLGIGTLTPAQQLHVVGNTRIEGDLRLIGTENEYGWVSRTSAADNNWYNVIWASELGLFVAVSISGTLNRVMTSPDGIIWTSRTTPVDNNWVSSAWSRELNLLVVVGRTGSGNQIMTSPDGINWTTRSTPTNAVWNSITWSSELSLFVAIARGSNIVMRSSNGINWTTSTAVNNSNWNSVIWSKQLGIFCAVAWSGSSNRAMTSPDGITWTTRTTNNNEWWFVTWADTLGLFVSLSRNGTNNRVMTSPDGITWTTRTTPIDESWRSCIWSKETGLLVAVSSEGSSITSTDGINWQTITTPVNNDWRGITYAPELNRFVAVAQTGTGNRVMTWDLPNYSKVVNFANGKIGANFFPQISVDIQDSVRANSFFVNSDERIKTDIHLLQQPDNLPDLYSYKFISNNKKELGFIAQYLENHHPNAIKTITDFIPNINSNVHTYDNILYNLNECSVGDKLLITVNGNKKEVSVIKVEEDHVYINENIGENIVYVYGKKVNDFKTIDKDYLFSLNFALTLKLLKSITELENEKNSI